MRKTEVELISRLKKILSPSSKEVLVGIGDDAAVLEPPANKLVATVDLLVEDIHFDLEINSSRLLGRKAMSVNASDIAAMGGNPRYALVSVGLKDNDYKFVEALYTGLKESCVSYGIEIVGGDISYSPKTRFVDVTVWGEVEKPVKRKGARPGDVICVTGNLGGAAGGLRWLNKNRESKKLKDLIWAVENNDFLQEPFYIPASKHLVPQARIKQGKLIAQKATSMIDISDGFCSEIGHIVRNSEAGAKINLEKLPIPIELKKIQKEIEASPLELALFGGEDYELLFTVPPEEVDVLAEIINFSEVGEIKEAEYGTRFFLHGEEKEIKDESWDHLRQNYTEG